METRSRNGISCNKNFGLLFPHHFIPNTSLYMRTMEYNFFYEVPLYWTVFVWRFKSVQHEDSFPVPLKGSFLYFILCTDLVDPEKRRWRIVLRPICMEQLYWQLQLHRLVWMVQLKSMYSFQALPLVATLTLGVNRLVQSGWHHIVTAVLFVLIHMTVVSHYFQTQFSGYLNRVDFRLWRELNFSATNCKLLFGIVLSICHKPKTLKRKCGHRLP